MKKSEKHQIRIALLIGLIAVVVLSIYNFNVFSFMLYDLEIDIPDDDFVRFAILVNIGYDMLPTVAQQFSIGATTTQLLMTGFSPLLLAIISAFALMAGQMILYVVGMLLRKVHKGSIGDLASKSHFLHEHHFLIYLMIPFVGILGDAVMIYSGHQRINPVKIIPFLLIANFASSLRWILSTLGQLEIAEFF